MTAADTSLPPGFEALDGLVRDWAIEGEGPRNNKRLASDMPALKGFYDAVLPRMPDIMAHLDQHPLDAAPPPQTRLLLLALMFMEVAPAIELFHQPDVVDGFPMGRWQILQD